MRLRTVSQAAYEARRPERQGVPAVDLLQVPLLGRFLKWQHARTALQAPLFVLAAVMILHGLYGPDLAPKNLATVLTWVHYRGALVLVLLVAGNFFCLACPFLLPRELARRLFRPRFSWPRSWRNKWLAVALFVLILFSYELFGLWSVPLWTAWLILAYFAGAVVVDGLFKHASFCKWVCPLGQFNFLSSTLSPLEVAIRDPATCASCSTQDCIKGTPAPEPKPQNNGQSARWSLPVVQRGCELALFQPLKVGNMDCTFCLDCVHACPHDNVGVVSRLPGAELWADTSRSGLGRFSQRKDLAALVVVFTFGALLNAFGMVSPVYVVQAWLARLLGITTRGPILGLLFVVGLILEPVVLLSLSAWLTKRLTGTPERLLPLATRFTYSLVPLGFAVWVAHYSFHFLTGALTFVPVAQNAVVDAVGWPLLGTPLWTLGGLREGTVYPLELGMLGLGLLGSWIVSLRLARDRYPDSPLRAFAPWGVLHLALFLAAVWLLSQPMEMRGTFLGS